MENKQGELQVMGTQELMPQLESESGALLQMAIDKDLDVDKLEKIIELKIKEELRQCKRDFDYHFAEMQKDFKPVQRTKKGYSNKYAPLEDLQSLYSPIISEHGFSYKWNEQIIDTGKRVTLIITGYGYTDKDTTFDVPKLEKTNQMNSIQVLAAMSSYGKRYTFTSGFGIIIEDEDTDGNLTFDDGVQYADQVLKLQNCNTKKELITVWKDIYKNLGTDKIGIEILSVVKDKQKKKVNG